MIFNTSYLIFVVYSYRKTCGTIEQHSWSENDKFSFSRFDKREKCSRFVL